jgi:hypothetical protein
MSSSRFRATVAAQVALALCTLAPPAWSQQPPPPLPPPSAAAPAAAPSVQVIQVAQPEAAVSGAPVRIFDMNKLEAPRPMVLAPLGGKPICEAPSTTPCVAAPGRYRVTGRGMRDSQEFDLSGTSPVDIRVDRGSKAAFYTGIGVASAGGVLGLTGGLFLLAAPSQNNWSSRYSYVDQEEIFKIYGWTFIALGTAALITGIVLLTGHSSSTATVTPTTGGGG